MTLLGEVITERSKADEAKSRVKSLRDYLPKNGDLLQGIPPEELAEFEEMLHRKLVDLEPQGIRDFGELEDFKIRCIAQKPALGKLIDDLGMSVYDLLFSIARGVENFSVPPLSAHREVSGE